MIIDIHTHPAPRTSLPDVNGTDFPTAEEMIARMDELGIDKAVLQPVPSPEAAHRLVTTEDVLAMVEQHPDRFIPFCNVDPRQVANGPETDFGPTLEYYKEAGCKGFGEVTANLAFDDPLVDNMLRQCEAAKLPVCFHIAPHFGGCYGLVDDLGLPKLERALARFPHLIFLGHSPGFWAEISGDANEENRNTYVPGEVTPGGRVIELLDNYPNLYGDISAGSGFNAISRDPEFGFEFMERYQDRLLFGTDGSRPRSTTRSPAGTRTGC